MKRLLAAFLRDIAESLDPKQKNEYVVVKVDGKQIIQAIRRDQRRRGIA